MSIEKNVQIVKNFLAALGRRDKQGLLALSAEDIEWIIPGEDWPLAGTVGQSGAIRISRIRGRTPPWLAGGAPLIRVVLRIDIGAKTDHTTPSFDD
ncbi:MAG TPA: hypothetical protein VHX49_02125 [Candidatus Acidoferrales bacterium]|nr:hypothetical protein [Candidatus Acidoferrales bacterium]